MRTLKHVRGLAAIVAFLLTTHASAQTQDREQQDLTVWVHYDYMGYADSQDACSTDHDCTALGRGHSGERCIGPRDGRQYPRSPR